MEIIDYETTGGQKSYKRIFNRIAKSRARYWIQYIRHKIVKNGLAAITELDTRQLRGDLWEIKFSKNRIMYILRAKQDKIYFLHACRKQKGKAEQFDIDTAISRAKEKGLDI